MKKEKVTSNEWNAFTITACVLIVVLIVVTVVDAYLEIAGCGPSLANVAGIPAGECVFQYVCGGR